MSVGLLVMLWSQTLLDEREGEPIKAGWVGLRIGKLHGLMKEHRLSRGK